MLMQLEMGKKQLEAFGKQAEMIESAIVEINSTLETLNSVSKAGDGSDVLMPVGAGSFMRAKLTDTSNVIMGVGGTLSIERKIPAAITSLTSRRDSLSQTLMKVNKTMGEVGMKMAELDRATQQIMGQHMH